MVDFGCLFAAKAGGYTMHFECFLFRFCLGLVAYLSLNSPVSNRTSMVTANYYMRLVFGYLGSTTTEASFGIYTDSASPS